LLPVSLLWIINIGISTFYSYINYNKILALITGEINLAGILSILPLVIMAVITPFLGKAIGFKILNLFLSRIIWIVKVYRKPRKQKVLP
jgi:hypothetical protein